MKTKLERLVSECERSGPCTGCTSNETQCLTFLSANLKILEQRSSVLYCGNCKHATVHLFSDPCNVCRKKDKYEDGGEK